MAKHIEFDEEGFTYKSKKPGRGVVLIAMVGVIGMFFGMLGGVGGILLLSADNSALANKLGINKISGISIPTTRTEKLILEESSAVTDVASNISLAVVSIKQKSQVTNIFGQVYQQEGAGTGFIITNDGLVLTNKHVASDLNASYTVVMSDGKTYEAKVQSQDPFQDLAVLKIDGKNLPVVELGDSDDIKVGQSVIAVGNALGRFENSVTTGVISARNRKIEATDANGANSETLDNMFQTDAAINSGNSGGPLVNLKGQVIGINTAVASGAQGIGFAIPINEAKSAIESIKTTGRIVRPYLGVRYVQLTKDIASQNQIKYDYGVMVIKGSGLGQVAVVPGSPADKAGIIENDIILEINGEKIDQSNGLLKLVQQYKVGDTVEIKFSSKDKEKTVKVQLEESK